MLVQKLGNMLGIEFTGDQWLSLAYTSAPGVHTDWTANSIVSISGF